MAARHARSLAFSAAIAVLGASSAARASDTGDADAEHLRATLDAYAHVDHRARLALGWTTLGIGVAGIGGFAYLATRPKPISQAAPDLAIVGGAFFGIGLESLLSTRPLEQLADYARRGASVERVEDAWRIAAYRERRLLRFSGIFGFVVSGAFVALGVVYATHPSSGANAASDGADLAGLSFSCAAVTALASTYWIASDGPVETALHAYEGATGRRAPPDASALGHLRIGALPGGGAMGAFTTSF